MSSNQLSGFNYGVPPYANLPIKNITAAYLVQPSDNGWILNCTSGTFTVSLAPAATLGRGFNCWIWNTGDGTVTIDPSGSETIDGTGTTYILRPRAGVQIVCNGTSWITGDLKAYRLYQESSPNDGNYTRPVASGFGAVAIGNGASASAQYAASFGFFARATGDGGVALGSSLASGADSIAISGAQGLGSSTASASNAIAIGVGTSTTSTNSTAIGRNSGNQGSQAVTGSGAMALGGSYASGTDSFAAAVANNTSSYGAKGANSVAIGKLVLASNTNSLAIGGASNQAKGAESAVIGGQNSETATAASYAVVIGGSSSYADGVYSFAQGFDQLSQYESTFTSGASAYAGVIGKQARASGKFAGRGDAQTGTFVLRRATTDGTATVLTTDNTAPGTTDQVILPNNSAYAFTGTVVARQQASGGTASAAWKVEGLIRREGSAATTVLVNSALTVIDNTPGWTLALSADTTNGGLAITATGAAATNIRWVATVQTSEVTYA